MRQRFPLFIGLLLVSLASTASAGPITYSVSIDTSSIFGTAGSLDFNLIPGPLITQSASVQVLSFISDGALAGNCPCGIGDVSGQLPANVTFDNGAGFNDYFDRFTFGNAISFDVSLDGPALSAPDGTSTSGSKFAFSMFFDPAGTSPVLTSDTTGGFAFTADVNLDGTTTISNYSTATTVSPLNEAPEPNSLLLFGAALGSFGLWQTRKPGRRRIMPFGLDA
jgi:hypothetical protein